MDGRSSAQPADVSPPARRQQVAGRFERFDATIRFDPADLSHSSLQVVVDLLSARTGDTDRDTALQGSDFPTTRWPKGTFTSTGIKSLGDGHFEATGKLTLRDVTRDVRLQFRRFDPAAPSGGAARMIRSSNLRRLEFGVGQGDWRGTEWLDDEVRIKVSTLHCAPHADAAGATGQAAQGKRA